MAQLTLAQIAGKVADELGLPTIASVVNNTNTTTRQVLALCNRSGDELYQNHQWTPLQNYSVINITTPTYSGNATSVAGSTSLVLTSNTGIIANYFAVTGIQIPTAARVTAVNVDGVTITMDEPSTYTGVSPVIITRDTFALPADFQWFLNRTMWDRTNHWELIGPMSPQADEYQRSGIVAQGPRRRWRQVGLPNTCWRIWPPPTATNDYPVTLVFEYVSNYWVLAADGVTPKASFTSDDDTSIVNSQAIVLSVKWRLWQAKGFEYGSMQAESNDYNARLASRDGGAPDLSMGRPSTDDFLLDGRNIPDGSWPGN